jgi:hypothetical protein
MNKGKIALLILSCDKYYELWDPVFKSIDEFWKDCKYDKFLLTNFKDYNYKNVNVIKVGEDISWSNNLAIALSEIRKTYSHVLISLDDLFLNKKVDNQLLESVIESFILIDGNYLKLIEGPKHTRRFNDLFGEIEPGSIYRPTCVFALWKISILEELLVLSENAWEFERKGAVRSNSYDKFFVIYKDIFIYRNSVVRGKIVRADAKKYGLLNTKELTVMTVSDHFSFKMRYYFFKIAMTIIPWKLKKPALKFKNFILNKQD